MVLALIQPSWVLGVQKQVPFLPSSDGAVDDFSGYYNGKYCLISGSQIDDVGHLATNSEEYVFLSSLLAVL